MSALREVRSKHLGGMETVQNVKVGLEGWVKEGWHSSLGRGSKMKKHRFREP